MKLNYYEETDSLYIDLSHRVSADSKEVADGLVIDFDEVGHVVGIDIQHASRRIGLTEIAAAHLSLLAKVA